MASQSAHYEASNDGLVQKIPLAKAERPSIGFTLTRRQADGKFSDDATKDIGENVAMTSISREEIAARLEATEARMDARMAGMESKLDTALAEMRADRHRFGALEKRMDELSSDMKDVEKTVAATATSIRWNLWASSLSVIAVMVAILTFGFDSFTAGREQGSSLASAAADIKQTQEQLKTMQERIERAASAPAAPSKTN